MPYNVPSYEGETFSLSISRNERAAEEETSGIHAPDLKQI